MAVRFTIGTNTKSTRDTAQAGKVPAVQKNSMKGLPGYVKTTQDASDGGLKNKSGIGPHREGSIGKRGSSGAASMDAGKFRGSSDKSYRATSTGPAGKIATNKGAPATRSGSEKEGPKRGKPTSGFHQGGSGKMESLRGKARTSWEH